MSHFVRAFCIGMLVLAGCENADVRKAVEAGSDAVMALTISDREVREIASRSAQTSDRKHTLAPPKNAYAQRLDRLVARHRTDGDLKLNYGVYLSPEVNAFAMADGTVRIYSGLMDMLTDGELLFVVGHEMGHVVKGHVREKMQLAYAARAVRKGVASQSSAAGDVAQSVFGEHAESLVNSQFSQLEEKEADDHGLAFLKAGNLEPRDAVTALQKIGGLSKGRSFLSSHPDPDKRAQRLQAQVEGRSLSIDEARQSLPGKVRSFLEGSFASLLGLGRRLLPWCAGVLSVR
jgi:putative metalloprotease